MVVTSNHIVKYLLESETLPTPQKIDPIAASPMILAFCADMLYQHNEQKTLSAKHKDDPACLPMAIINFVAEHVNIPNATEKFKQHPYIPVASDSGSNENSSPQPSEADVAKAVPLLDIRSLGYQGFPRGNLHASSVHQDPYYSATGRPIFLDHTTKRSLASLYLLSANSLARLNDDFYAVFAAHVDITKFPGLSSVYFRGLGFRV